MLKENTTKKHTAAQTVLLHLVPGLILLSVLFLLVPLFDRMGFINSFSGYLGVLIVTVPVQFGILLYAARKSTGTYKISKLIPFVESAKITEYLLFIFILIIWSVGVDLVISPLEIQLRDNVFSFLPDMFLIGKADTALYPKDKLIFTACFGILANGIIAPITEELYFRGYLLPRINLSPNLAVLVNAALFSLYHFFSPWMFFSRLLMMLPIYYWVMKRKNIRFSLLAHLIANTYTGIVMLLAIL